MNNNVPSQGRQQPAGALRCGWTTGACAYAAAHAACLGLLGGTIPPHVQIVLPHGQRPGFAIKGAHQGRGFARAGVEKDAGDDPDVTHGALIIVTLRRAPKGAGIRFFAGPGVGTVTRPGLALAVGEAAINPAPRKMIAAGLHNLAARYGQGADFDVEIAVPDGEKMAQKTLNGRLGIIGGISILGTTGIVKPYSCAAWIASVHRGIDVARAAGLSHVVAATGRVSEGAARRFFSLPDTAMIEMGDFAGATLKYLRRHPVARLTIAGGFAKIMKLSCGAMDLHARRSRVDMAVLARIVAGCGAGDALLRGAGQARSAGEVLQMCRAASIDIAAPVARNARDRAQEVLRDAPVAPDVMIVDRSGTILACTSAQAGAAGVSARGQSDNGGFSGREALGSPSEEPSQKAGQ